MQKKLILTTTIIIIAFVLIAMAAFIDSYTSSEVEKAFTDNEIVPDILNASPKKIINVSYPSGVTVSLGNELTPTQVKDVPQVSWKAENGAYYTLLMTDPDAPSRVSPTFREVRHWLIFNILESDITSGEEVFEYRGSGPPKGTNLHRYIFLVFKQPGIIQHTEPHVSNKSRANRFMTSVSELLKKYNLGDPEFGNFFQAQYDAYVDIIQAQSTE
ncbi:protein D1-like [Sitodiplosis mosellana]|uniref:protein D1-like n=1 Tax=Sitodiplosis mosellana TaxID=263140 RepID=UPI0024445A0C|nr:protein D1-like [Sitodiplosis mosellana]